MLRGVRERLGLRRARRQNPPPPSLENRPPIAPSVSRQLSQRLYPPNLIRRADTDKSSATHVTSPSGSPLPIQRSASKVPPGLHHAALPQHDAPTVRARDDATDSPHRQPRVFRNRSMDYVNRTKDARQLLGLFSAKALKPFQRGKSTPDKGGSGGDRPLVAEGGDNKVRPPSSETPRLRNDDSFSSLQSTHASRDPFLNDDVPVEITRMEGREDRPRAYGRRENEDLFPRGGGVFQSPGRLSNDAISPPASVSSTSTLRKRSSLWKRTYDPENECQTEYERQILKAVSLSEAAVKERRVPAAQQLADIVTEQIGKLEGVLGEVGKQVEHARVVAEELPSTRDARFERLLYVGGRLEGKEMVAGKAEAERVFLELQWTERVWDVEAMLLEKRFEDCVTSLEKLREDGISESASPRTLLKYQNIVQQLVAEMSAWCTLSGGESASEYAPLLARVGMADHARQVVLSSAEAELTAELNMLTAVGLDSSPRTVSAMLDRALVIFNRTYGVYAKISVTGSQNASFFVAWVAEQSDNIYKKCVSPILSKMRKADPVTILATIEAARHRPRPQDPHTPQPDCSSLVALLETRMTAHVRHDLDGPVRDAERQLLERARMYAAAFPRNWREGPYQSGKAICDELHVLCRGLEGALMGLGTDTDTAAGALLAGPALEYCCALMEAGNRAAAEVGGVPLGDVQRGMAETFGMVSKTLMRLHQKHARVPFLERAALGLASPKVEEVKMLQVEVSARKAPAPGRLVANQHIRERVVRGAEGGQTLGVAGKAR